MKKHLMSLFLFFALFLAGTLQAQTVDSSRLNDLEKKVERREKKERKMQARLERKERKAHKQEKKLARAELDVIEKELASLSDKTDAAH